MSDNSLLNYDVRFPSSFISRRAHRGKNVSQMHYARKGTVTPEMEFVALRESMQLERLLQDPYYASLARQHRGQSWGTRLPEQITPEFVRAEVASHECSNWSLQQDIAPALAEVPVDEREKRNAARSFPSGLFGEPALQSLARGRSGNVESRATR